MSQTDAGGTDRQARVIRDGEGRESQLRYGRGAMIKLVDPEIGAEQVDLHLNVILAGSAPGPYHLHTSAENVYHVLSGRVKGAIRAAVPAVAGTLVHMEPFEGLVTD